MRRTSFRKVACAALAALTVTLTAFTSCTDGRKPSTTGAPKVVKMGAVPSAFYLPIFVVQEQGLLKKRGYDSTVEVFNANTNMMDAFIAGNVDLAAQSSGTMFPLELKHPGLFKFVYGQNANSYSFIVKSNSPNNSLRDLNGKKIATWNSPTAKLTIELCLKPFFDPSNVEIRQVDFKLLNQVLENGEVDAVFGPDVFPTQGVRSGKARYLESNPMPKYVLNPFFNGGGFVNANLIKESPELAGAVKEAFDEAIEFINSHNEEARRLMVKYVPADEQDLLTTPLDQFIPNEQVDMEKAQRVADIFSENGLMNRKVEISGLFYRK